MAEACNCSFGRDNIADESVLLQCRDSISAEVSLEIKPVTNTYAVRVLSDISRCGHIDTDKVNVLDSRTGEKEHVSNSGSIAVTVASVCAALGLIVAAVIVCLKCRRAPLPVKKHSKGENELIEDLSADLLSAVAPTPKSMYRNKWWLSQHGFLWKI
ncbi:hypothetical protein OS493_001563 [Desmophyllum pertusum]|uniref:Uncharacterized protein n=1 Tax=Desmophyllum pertusum TaxID=174260 RepID=A0A9W9ZGS7_9CNID|nr:hypothetical protein OS493_001563 [Desmophyllum pertusum]